MQRAWPERNYCNREIPRSLPDIGHQQANPASHFYDDALRLRNLPPQLSLPTNADNPFGRPFAHSARFLASLLQPIHQRRISHPVECCEEAATGASGVASECTSLVRQDVFPAGLEVPINLPA